MKLDMFLNLWRVRKTDKDKAELLAAHIKTAYVPIATKIDKANDVIAASFYKDGVFHQNSPLKYVNTCLSLIQLYTDLDLPAAAWYDSFDKLNSINLFELVMQCINEYELKEYDMIINMVASDAIMNEKMDIE